MRSVRIAARGPKPQAALRDVQVPVSVVAAEPSTWREMLTALQAEFGESLATMRVAVQEYGASNPEFLSALNEQCAEVTKVPVYQWTLPEDVRPLRECVLGIAHGTVDVVLFMTAVQVIHLFQIAEQMNCSARSSRWPSEHGRGFHRPHNVRGTRPLRRQARLRAFSPQDGFHRQRSRAVCRQSIA